jgi:uncharacterized protein (TIGR03437 family)
MRITRNLFLLASLAISTLRPQPYIISTIAGGPISSAPVAGVQSSIGKPWGVAADAAGNVYFTGVSCVLKVDAHGMLSRVAGTGSGGYSGDGGPATAAQLGSLMGMAADTGGNLYFAGSQVIRKVSPSGTITTLAGNGLQGYTGDGGLATSARLSNPCSVAVDAAGNLYIADSTNQRIRKVSAAGIISTIAGNGTEDYSGDGGPATSASFSNPQAVAVDSAGAVYIADLRNRVRRVSADGTITTYAGNGSFGSAGDGGPATDASLSGPSALAFDAAGNLYIAEASTNRIRKVTPGGVITTVAGNGTTGWAGDGGPATSARLSYPYGVAVDPAGNLYVADNLNARIRKVSSSGIITTIAGNGFISYSGDGGPASASQLYAASTLALDRAGNLFVGDAGNYRIRKISAAGMVSTVAGNGTNGYSGDGGPATNAQIYGIAGLAIDGSGNIYFTDGHRVRRVSSAGTITTFAGNGSATFGGDGGPAANAQLYFPNSLAVDDSGNLFIADGSNGRIRKVSASGVITTVAGDRSAAATSQDGPAGTAMLSPGALALGPAGELYFSDAGTRIRKLTSSGMIVTIAGTGTQGYSGDGGPATAARFAGPQAMRFDESGNLYIADQGNHRIRRISPEGIVTTIAGNGQAGFAGDGGPATSASLSGPADLAMDARGNIYVADLWNNAIRILTPSGLACAYSASPTSIQSPAAGGSVSIAITTGPGCPWSIGGLPSWIAIAGAANGAGPSTVTFDVAPNSGAPRSAQISVAGIIVTLVQVSEKLLISDGGVVSAATYGGPIAPGSIASIFGSFLLASPVFASSTPVPTALGGLSFRFGGAAAPVFFAHGTQANVQVPWELAGQSQTTVTASMDGQTSGSQSITLAPYAPGIFSTSGDGKGQGTIVDVQYRLVDSANPAAPGDTVLIFCTGLGPVTHQPATGAAAPAGPLAETTSQPTVLIGGSEANVTFSGLAPSFVGLYQVNVQTPQAAAKGSAVPVTITIGGVRSNTVTIAVR